MSFFPLLALGSHYLTWLYLWTDWDLLSTETRVIWSASSVMVGDGPSHDVLVPRPGSLTLCTVSSLLLWMDRVDPRLLGLLWLVSDEVWWRSACLYRALISLLTAKSGQMVTINPLAGWPVAEDYLQSWSSSPRWIKSVNWMWHDIDLLWLQAFPWQLIGTVPIQDTLDSLLAGGWPSGPAAQGFSLAAQWNCAHPRHSPTRRPPSAWMDQPPLRNGLWQGPVFSPVVMRHSQWG